MKHDTSQYQFELASSGDNAAILHLFNKVTETLLTNGIDQWDGTYPTLDIISKDIQSSNCWILKDREDIIASFVLNEEQDVQYDQIQWQYHGRVAVLHRVAVSPNSQGKGIGKALCHFAEDSARSMGYQIIRLDTYSRNPVSNNLYQSLGYKKAKGLCYFHGNKTPFYCYEKALSL